MIPKNPRRTARRSIPAAVVVVLATVVVLAHPVISHWGHSAYAESTYASAANRFGHLETANVYEPHKAPFNRGTSLMQEGELAEARTALTEALEIAPPPDDCQVRFNLVLTIERQGDDAVRQHNPTTAILLYTEALELIAADPCDREDTEEEAAQLEEARIRIEEKLRQLQEQPPTEADPEPEPEEQEDDQQDQPGDPQPTPQEPDDLESRLNELDDRNQENLGEQWDIRNERLYEEEHGGPGSYTDPQW